MTMVEYYLNLSPEDILTAPIYWYGVALLFALCFLWWLIRKLRVELVPVFSDNEGAVQITPQALRELVRKSCASIPGVHAPKTRILKKGSSLRLNVCLRVDQNCKVKETRSHLKEKLEGIMINNLNFDNFEGVDLVIAGFQNETP